MISVPKTPVVVQTPKADLKFLLMATAMVRDQNLLRQPKRAVPDIPFSPFSMPETDPGEPGPEWSRDV